MKKHDLTEREIQIAQAAARLVADCLPLSDRELYDISLNIPKRQGRKKAPAMSIEEMVRQVVDAAIREGLVEVTYQVPYDDVSIWTAGDLVVPAEVLAKCLEGRK